jgi:hypothetical protein
MTVGKAEKVGLLWRGNRSEGGEGTAQNDRLNRVFEALIALGILAEPAIYADDMVDDVREQLLKLDGVLVWVDPISDGQNRTQLDAMLRDLASKGVWVSAHPDVILKMGVKEVLYRTKHLGWGTDTHLYRTVREFNEQFPQRLQSAGPRVLKQNRGNGGQGVWKAELVSSAAHKAAIVRVLHARRGSVPEEMLLGDFMRSCVASFANDGCIVDQPFQARLRRHDPLLHGRGQGHRFRSPTHQSVDPAAAGRPGLARRTTRPTYYASRVRTGVSNAEDKDGIGVDAADDAVAGHRYRVSADHLGRRLPVWTAGPFRRRHLCALRDKYQFRTSVSGTSAVTDRATRTGPIKIRKERHTTTDASITSYDANHRCHQDPNTNNDLLTVSRSDDSSRLPHRKGSAPRKGCVSGVVAAGIGGNRTQATRYR